MSKPRYGWWGYAKWMIRNYKTDAVTEEERNAVEQAIEETQSHIDGAERLQVIDLVLWRRTHTVPGAAMVVYVSERTARRWHTAFILCVAKYRGLI